MSKQKTISTAQLYRNLMHRVKNLVLQPRSEWTTVRGERKNLNEVLSEFSLPLISLVTLATFLNILVNHQGFNFELALKHAALIFTSLFGPLQFLDSVDLHGGGSGHLPGAKRPADTAYWFQHPPPALAGSTNSVQSDSLLIVWLQIRSTSKTNVHFSISKSSKNMWQAYNWQAPKSNPFAWARPVWSMLIAFFCATNCG